MTAPAPPGAEPFARRLGCATNYTAQIWYWDRARKGLRKYTDLTGIFEVTWERVLDDASETRIRFRPKKGDDCCGKLKTILNAAGQVIETGVWVWAHELALFRDGELVWQGPIFSIDELVLPDEVTDHIQITARDMIGWLDRRVVHNDISMTDRTYDFADMAKRVIEDGLGPDPLGILPDYLTVTPTGKTGKRTIRKWESTTGEELREIARGGLDFTAVGRRIIVGSPSHNPADPVLTLRTGDFAAGVEIRMVGAEAATVGYAVGGQPTAANPNTPIEDIPPKKARFPALPDTGVDPFFGLVENWTQSEGVLDEGFLRWIAEQKVKEGNPPPRTLSVPADTGLAPEAPVSIHHLIPGTFFIVAVAGTCLALHQFMRLSHLRVTWNAQEPEKVGVTFIPGALVPTAPAGRSPATAMRDLLARLNRKAVATPPLRPEKL